LPRKVLLADDSVTAQNMGRKILTDAGYEVVTVNNGSAALKKLAESRPDLMVLDVYMPGYSGLEVCQRVKDNRETASLPVLLTVGKLEPFKQDEARRVRADAFIIKPFEASELLAALGKLEDKLVAPEPVKPSRHVSSTMASFERIAQERGPKYGDEESGWKERLKIPSEGPRATEPESLSKTSEPESAATVASATVSVMQAAGEEAPVEESRPFPSDITAEEVAALNAAMSRISSGVDSEPTSSAQREEETATHAARAETDSPVQAEAQPAVEETAVPTAVAEHVESVSAEISSPPATEEIETALSAIAPANGNSPVVSETTATAQKAELETVASGAATAGEAASPGATGIRWVAEEVAIEAGESGLILEREMEKASASEAAAENAALYSRYEPAPIDRDDEPGFATMAPPAIGSPVPYLDGGAAQSAGPSEREPDFSLPASAASDAQDISAMEVSRPPAPPFAAAVSASTEDAHGVAAFGGPHPFFETAEAVAPKAAAPEETPALESEEAESQPAEVSAESAVRREAEIAAATAAAWSNWKDIRDSVTGAKLMASQPPDPAAVLRAELEQLKELKKSKQEEERTAISPEKTMAAAAAADNSPSPDPVAAESDTIASIVDSMLAELRPKLVAEIAKKLEKK
jgi:CheY-like chemotaxis protein